MIMEYPYKKDWWETKDHKEIKISDMETSHIENAIKFLKNAIIFMMKNMNFMIMMMAKLFIIMMIIHT